MTIIAVVGFPHSGKTTYLRKYLYNKLRSSGVSFFIQSANPDGEGQWTVESPNGRQMRPKGEWDNRFVDWIIKSIKNLAKVFDAVYLDCGGKQSPENQHILQFCDEVLIIAKNGDDAYSWYKFAKRSNPKLRFTFIIGFNPSKLFC